MAQLTFPGAIVGRPVRLAGVKGLLRARGGLLLKGGGGGLLKGGGGLLKKGGEGDC